MRTILEERQVLRAAQNHPKATPRQVETGEDRALEADASVAGGSREMVEACGARLLQLSRPTPQSPQSPQFSAPGSQTLAAADSSSPSDGRGDAVTHGRLYALD